MIERRTLPAALLLSVSGLASCGGGGGGNAAPESPVVTPPPVPPVSIGPPTPASPTALFQDETAQSGFNYAHGYILDSTGTYERDSERFGGGVAAGDYDGDGDIDLFIVRGDIGPNLLYANNGDGTFVDVAAEAGVAMPEGQSTNYRLSGPAFADLDGDGDLDLFVGGLSDEPPLLYRNDGDGTFTDVTADAGLDALVAMRSISASFGDYDLDGDLDMFVGHWGTTHDSVSIFDTGHLWRNESDQDGIRFTSASLLSGLTPSIIVNQSTVPSGIQDTDFSFAATFARINDDLYPDLVVVADFNTSQYFVNNGDGTFTNATNEDVITDNNGMGSALGDYDNDGDLDWFVTAIYMPPGSPNGVEEWTGNRLYVNDDGIFFDETDVADVREGGWGWGACFIDFENDGLLDIYHTNGWDTRRVYEDDQSRAFVYNGDRTFTEDAEGLGLHDTQEGRSVVCADFDGDGDEDIVQIHRGQGQNSAASFYRNTSTNNYLAVRLQGLPPNTEAAGARMFATVGDITQMREIFIGNSFTAQDPATKTFGLGNETQVDELRIEWPDGKETVQLNVAAGQLLTIQHPDL